MSPNQGLKPNNLVQTIERASSILDILGQSPQGISIRELSSKIKLPKGTIHRLLSSLSYFGYVRQDPKTRNYLLGFKLVEFGQPPSRSARPPKGGRTIFERPGRKNKRDGSHRHPRSKRSCLHRQSRNGSTHQWPEDGLQGGASKSSTQLCCRKSFTGRFL